MNCAIGRATAQVTLRALVAIVAGLESNPFTHTSFQALPASSIELLIRNALSGLSANFTRLANVTRSLIASTYCAGSCIFLAISWKASPIASAMPSVTPDSAISAVLRRITSGPALRRPCARTARP